MEFSPSPPIVRPVGLRLDHTQLLKDRLDHLGVDLRELLAGGEHDGESSAGNDPHGGDDNDTDNRPPFYVLAAKQRIDNSI